MLGIIEDNFLSDQVLINKNVSVSGQTRQADRGKEVTLISSPLSEELVDGYRSTADGYIAKKYADDRKRRT